MEVDHSPHINPYKGGCQIFDTGISRQISLHHTLWLENLSFSLFEPISQKSDLLAEKWTWATNNDFVLEIVFSEISVDLFLTAFLWTGWIRSVFSSAVCWKSGTCPKIYQWIVGMSGARSPLQVEIDHVPTLTTWDPGCRRVALSGLQRIRGETHTLCGGNWWKFLLTVLMRLKWVI